MPAKRRYPQGGSGGTNGLDYQTGFLIVSPALIERMETTE